jgi:hypothetical protein
MEDDWTLASQVEATRALRDRSPRLVVLAPRGAWIGCGTLRVLRVRSRQDDSIELTAGYESYQRVAASRDHDRS